MADFEIACIIRNGPKNDCTCITHVRGIYGTKFSVSDVLILINNGDRFFVRDRKNNQISYVMPAERLGRKYIRTKPDDDKNDNLLSLPDCS